MKDMTFEEKILRNDISGNHYTEHDIKQHLKSGVFFWEDYTEFYYDWVAAEMCAPEDAPRMWADLDRSIVDGKEYRYDVAL